VSRPDQRGRSLGRRGERRTRCRAAARLDLLYGQIRQFSTHPARTQAAVWPTSRWTSLTSQRRACRTGRSACAHSS